MITTKRYDYISIEKIGVHPSVGNHRHLDTAKVSHYVQDITEHGLLEPLVVWERNNNEYFLVGGFHRIEAMRAIRKKNPGYFDMVDVRVVSGEPDEMRALNLKLNADRVDTKLTDYFDTIIHLNNVNWSNDKIAQFLDRPVAWVDDIIQFVPGMPAEVRDRLAKETISWTRAKAICKAVRQSKPGHEAKELKAQLAALEKPATAGPKQGRVLTIKQAKRRLSDHLKSTPKTSYQLDGEDLLSLLLVIEGKEFTEKHRARVEAKFPHFFTKNSGK